MPLIPISLPPGIYANGTDLQSAGRWLDANLVRWTEGTMRPVGGWESRTASTLNAAPRGALAWADLSGDKRVAFGTYNKLYSLSANGTLSDITPVGLTAGTESGSVNTGFGGNFFGTGFYGTSRPDSGVYGDATTWALDTWGENLVACSVDDGKLYEWGLDTGILPTAVTNAPTGNASLIVTPERFLVALGANSNSRRVQWSDRENNTLWTAAATNEAGDFDLQTSGVIMCGLRMRGETLILTSQDAHTMTYVGPPFVYGFERAGEACGVIGRKAATSAEGRAFWMGNNGFYTYAGGAVEEIPCEVSDHVFANLNTSQRSKVYAVSNATHDEVWWFYPQGSECDSYVAYNYKENHWNIGSIDRTAGVDAGVFTYPIWASSGGTIYDHEKGYNYDGASVYAESGPLGLSDGVLSATDLIPDEEMQGEVTATFKTRFYPNDTEYTHGPYTMANPTSVRFTGRQVRMRIEANTLGDWRVGNMRLDVRAVGRR